MSTADTAARLLRFLRDLARARHDPARVPPGGGSAEPPGPGADRLVHWLAELPGDVYVETDAGLGDVLFSVPVIPLSPPADRGEFDAWLALRHWYRLLRDVADQGGAAELATGLLSWRPAEGPAVGDHLLTTPVRLVADDRTGRVDVLLDGPTSLRDRELLAGLPGFRPARTDWVWDAVQAGQGFGLRSSVSDVLRKWCTVAFRDETVAFREDWAPSSGPPSAAPRLRVAPALVVRPRGRAAVADYYENLLARLPDLPQGFADLLEPAGRSPLLHVPERTPHAIADLLTGLLARGLGVLVASDATDLHAALHPRVAALCDPDAFAQAAGDAEPVDDLVRREAAAAQTAAELRDRLRLAETTDVCDLGPGYRGDRADLARRLEAEAVDHDWLPPHPDLPTTPPLTAAEAAELRQLLADQAPDRTRHRDIDPCALPSAPYVRTLIEAEVVAAERAERNETDLSRRLRRCDVALLARLDGCATTVNNALRDLGLAGHPSGWDAADHAVRAFTDALARRRPAVWARVAEMEAQADWAARAMEPIADRDVELPPGELHLRRLAGIAQDLRTYLLDGGTLKRGPLRSTAQRQAESLLGTVTVDGEPPTTPQLLETVFTHLMVRMACQELQYVWEAAGVSFPADVPLADRVARFGRAHARLTRVRDILPAIEESTELLAGASLGIPITHPLQWYGYFTGLESALLAQGVNRAAADLTALRDSIGAGPEDPPELHRALAAIEARNADAYGDALIDLAEARHERAAQLRRADYLDRLHAAHPDLAEALSVPSDAWPARLARWDEAWAWAHASARLADVPRSPAEAHLRTALAEAESRHRDLTAARAWNAHHTAGTAPARIIPLWEIPGALPPDPGSFDVAIVDGDQSTGAEALFLLWLAPRLVLVGPPGPDLPVPEVPISPDNLPSGLHGLITPTTSLFSLLLTRFDDARPAPEPQEPIAPEVPAPVYAPSVPAPRPVPRPAPEQPAPARLSRAPVAEVEEAPVPQPRQAAGYAQAGRSIVAYKRPELVALIRRIAANEPALTDEQLVELARRLLACPADEEMLVGARLRFAVQLYRDGADE